MRDAAGEFDHFHAARQFAQRIRVHFAVLADDKLGQLVAVLFQQRLEIEHDARAAQRRGARPVGNA